MNEKGQHLGAWYFVFVDTPPERLQKSRMVLSIYFLLHIAPTSSLPQEHGIGKAWIVSFVYLFSSNSQALSTYVRCVGYLSTIWYNKSHQPRV